jgi:hypothetical protein
VLSGRIQLIINRVHLCPYGCVLKGAPPNTPLLSGRQLASRYKVRFVWLSSPHCFRVALLVSVLVGLVARLVFVVTTTVPIALDAVTYRGLASNLINGRGYVLPAFAPPHKLVASAAHPPLFSCVLAVFDALGFQSLNEQRISLAVVGSVAVLIMGLLGREAAGQATGIGAALIAALDPVWLQPTGALMSESIYLVLIPLVLLLAFRCLAKPTSWRFGALGLAIALAALTRSEAIDFVILLGVPLLLMVRVPWTSRCVLGLALVLGVALLLGPWLIRNQVDLGGAVLSTEEGGTLIGSYCSATFDPANPTYGSFSGQCAIDSAVLVVAKVRPPDRAKHWTDLSLDRALTESAKQYALNHIGDLPRVVVAREESAWGLGNQNFQLQLAYAEGRNRTCELIGRALYWVFLPFVAFGAVLLARRSPRRFLVVMVPVIVAVVTVALVYGSTRMRVVAEPSLAVLAAMGAVTAARWLRTRMPNTRSTLSRVPHTPG